MFLGGAAALSSDFNGVRCRGSTACSVGRTLIAFSWITWVALTLLLGLVTYYTVRGVTNGRKTAWREPFAADGAAGNAHATTTTTTGPAGGAGVAPAMQHHQPAMASV